MSARDVERRGAPVWIALAVLAACALGAGPARGADKAPDGTPVTGIPDGYVLTEGDILVRTSELVSAGSRKYATFQADKLWPGGVVPYALDPSVSGVQARVDSILAAMDSLMTAKYGSAITFVPRTNQADYIYYIDGGGNFSPVGKQGGRQDIHVVSWGTTTVICHETMHAVGFWHEQSRPDRDTYVTINLQNVCQTCCSGNSCNSNFVIVPGSTTYGPYDFDSVMQYDQCAFSMGTCPGSETITVNQPWTSTWQDAIGQRTHLSRMDKVTLSFLYPLANWRFADAFGFGLGSGGFLDPWHSLAFAVASMPSGGTLYAQPGSYTAPLSGSLSTPMTIAAPLGQVQISRAPSAPRDASHP